jgi:hypothetical protein
MLSEHLNLHIILILNTDDADLIEDDYLDCNSILMDIEFDELDNERATELNKHLGKNKNYKNSIKVSDVAKGLKDVSIEDEVGY